MYYFTCDDESIDSSEPILFKSTNLEKLMPFLETYQELNVNWTLSNGPINFDELEYQLL